MQQLLALAIASALAGCSLIYNPNNLPAAHDAAIDAEIIDPTMFEIDDVQPRSINEGQGEFGSPPAVVVIHGKNIVDRNPVVAIAPASGAMQVVVGAPSVADNAHWIAIPVTAKVDGAVGKGDVVALDVTVTVTLPADAGGGTRTATLHDMLAVVGLKELTRTTTPEVSGTTIDTTKLEPLYSKVDLQGMASAQLVGDARATIRAVSSISTATTPIVASGGGGGGGNSGGGAGAAIAGGCPGGGAGSRGGCGSVIGGDGGSASSTLGTAGGGGGGGFATVGDPGTGQVAGTGGSGTGDELIVTYDGFAGRTMNRAGGGGGGGNPMLAGKGGGGGAGGGSVELTAGGDLAIGNITADGGPGGPASSGLNGQAAGGGGGAGGLVMLRSGGALTTTGMVSVKGGGGAAGTGSNGSGGAGADGRVRWDAVTGSAPTAPSGTVHRGPAFKLDAQVVRTDTPSIMVLGTNNDRFDVYWTNGGMQYMGASYSIGPTGTLIKPTLLPGYNRLCLTLDGGQQGAAEADKCIDVAYLP